jgi:hypothetical protein
VLTLKGDRILPGDFLAQDREAFCALESDEAMFTYTKGRIDRTSGLVGPTPLFLEEPLLDPRPSYNLVVEDAEGFSAGPESTALKEPTAPSWAGIYVRTAGNAVMPRRPPVSCSTSASASPPFAEPRCGQRLTQQTWHQSEFSRSQASPTEDLLTQCRRGGVCAHVSCSRSRQNGAENALTVKRLRCHGLTVS